MFYVHVLHMLKLTFLIERNVFDLPLAPGQPSCSSVHLQGIIKLTSGVVRWIDHYLARAYPVYTIRHIYMYLYLMPGLTFVKRVLKILCSTHFHIDKSR